MKINNISKKLIFKINYYYYNNNFLQTLKI